MIQLEQYDVVKVDQDPLLDQQMGDSLDNIWQIKRCARNAVDVNEFKIELTRKLLETAGVEGEGKITDLNITIKREPVFNFKKLLTLKGHHEEKN